MTETKLIRIKPWRPLSRFYVNQLKAYQTFYEKKQRESGGSKVIVLPPSALEALYKGKRRQMLTRFLEWWDGRKISIEERNILRRRFNEWQDMQHNIFNGVLSRHVSIAAGLLSDHEVSELNKTDLKRLSDFAEKYLFCEPEEILRNAI